MGENSLVSSGRTSDLAFSVIVATHNRLKSLARTLSSLAAQSFPRHRYKVIVVDDGSVDGTWEWLEKTARAEGFLALRQENLGQGYARNYGLKHATAQYVALIDDDCVADSNWLTSLATALEGTGADAVAGSVVNGESNNTWAWASQEIVNFFAANAGSPGFQQSLLPANNIAYRRSALLELGGFDSRFRAGVAAEERELNHRLLVRGRKISSAPAAKVVHYNRVAFLSFLRQQFGYGGGAHIFYRLTKQIHGAALPHFPARVYLRLFLHFLRRRDRGLIPRMTALVLSQLAVALGYVWEAAFHSGPGSVRGA